MANFISYPVRKTIAKVKNNEISVIKVEIIKMSSEEGSESEFYYH
jgi:hypothetical protein